MTLPKDLKESVGLLNSLEVEYLVIGDFALAHHGYPRATADIDFLINRTEHNADKLVQVFSDFGFDSLGLTTADFLHAEQLIQVGRPPNRVDILTSASGIEFTEAWANRVTGEIDGVPVAFIGKDDLIRNKKASGRPKDLLDVSELEGM